MFYWGYKHWTGAVTQLINKSKFTEGTVLFVGMNFDTMIYVCVKPQLLMKNVDFRGRKSASEIL